jgi:hypothetical protein
LKRSETLIERSNEVCRTGTDFGATLILHYSNVHKRVALDVKPTLHKCLGYVIHLGSFYHSLQRTIVEKQNMNSTSNVPLRLFSIYPKYHCRVGDRAE